MRIDNREFTRETVAERIGNQAQLGGTRRVILNEGAAKGIEAIDVSTGAGLQFTILPDRGMDISRCEYKGINLVYITPNGEVSPAYYDAQGLGWLRTFFGGLLTTCGLTTIGAPGCDQGQDLGLHGRVTAIPARQVQDRSRWEEDEYLIEIAGTVDEVGLFDTCLSMTRTIRTRLGSRCLTISDEVTNTGYATAPFTVLYHINAGFPLLDADARLLVTADRTEAHDEVSQEGLSAFDRFSEPIPGYEEQNFLHRMQVADDGRAHAAMLNPQLMGGLGLALSFDPVQLPYLNEWKMMGQRDYVVGIEPCNAPCTNRANLRKADLLPTLEPGATASHSIDIEILDGWEAIESYRDRYARTPEFEPFTTL